MSKIDEIISYMQKTSLYEKQKLVDTLLKSDFRLENDAKKFYEEELKDDRAKMKELLLKEVEFEYEGKILLLERDKGVLQNQIDTINQTYNIQMENAQKVLNNKLEELDKEIKKLKQEKVTEITKIQNEHKEIIDEYRQKEYMNNNKINELENQMKSYQINHSFDNIFFLNKNYHLLTNRMLKDVLTKLQEWENKIYIPFQFKGFDNVDFKNKMFSHISSTCKLKLMTESVYESIFNYFKSLEITFSNSQSGDIMQVRVYDLMKDVIYNAETLYKEIFEI